jgi:3D (Asp-Asp-Asp) domain-containing protein
MRLKTIISLFLVLLLGVSAKGQQNLAHSSKTTFSKVVAAVAADEAAITTLAQARLARVTAYWPGEDYYTNRKMSATGARLRPGFCAVDSRIIPYGSVVTIAGMGTYLAMDTGTAVKSRKAAKLSGRNRDERNALVIDLYFPSRKAGEKFMRGGPKFAMVGWTGTGALASD